MTQGVGLAIAPVATSTNLAPKARRGESMSYMGNSISVAQLYAPPFGVFLYVTLCDTWFVTHGTGITFIAASVLALMAFLIALFISDTETRMPEATIGEDTEEAKKAPLVSKAAVFPTFVFLTYAFTMAPVSTFLLLLAEEIRIT